ncbi:MAG: methyltransferase domain-containing protein [Candidatus Woesearchaeota archaeon]
MHEKNLLNECPIRYGILFDLFRRSTNEEELIIDKILEKIKLKKHRNSLLDIGASDGNLIQKIMKFFNNTYAIEKRDDSTLFLDSLGIDVLENIWEDYKGRKKFDFILASHVFYYFPTSDWKMHLLKMMKLLNKEGILIVITNSIESEYTDFLRTFYHKILGEKFILESIFTYADNSNKDFKVTKERISTDIFLENKTHFLSMCEFWLGSSKENWGEIHEEISDYYTTLKNRSPQGKTIKLDLDVLCIVRR